MRLTRHAKNRLRVRVTLGSTILVVVVDGPRQNRDYALAGGMSMAFYTYDEEADALYILLVSEPEAAIDRTVELGERLHVDLGPDGKPVGVEILYPTRGGFDLEPLREHFRAEAKKAERFPMAE